MTILLADPHPEVQSALHRFVDLIPGVTMVSEAGNVNQLLAYCLGSCPDLILMDLDLAGPSFPLAQLVGELSRICPHARTIVLSSRLDALQEARAAGASGFISKTDSPDLVLAGILRFLHDHPSDGV